jgi:hypothetical protein
MLVVNQDHNQRHAASKPQRPGFRSYKTPQPIAYLQRWHRDILVQLTLDPNALRIEQGPGTRATEVFDLLVTTTGGVIRIFAFRDDIEAPSLPPGGNCISLKRSSVLKEPRAANARAIWSMRKKIVSPADRLRVLLRLGDHPGGLPISDLLTCVLGPSTEPAEAILALACEGLVALSLDCPLVPDTTVRLCHPELQTDRSV